jgi:hypothetical protein
VLSSNSGGMGPEVTSDVNKDGGCKQSHVTGCDVICKQIWRLRALPPTQIDLINV